MRRSNSSAQTVIKRPLLTEKSSRLRETGGASAAPAEGETYAQKVVFEVARDANKVDIRRAVQDLFKVTVTDVRTLVVRGKVKRIGRFSGQRPSWKKAFVTLKPGDNIEFFEGV
jgi:large subunit ribosomal protein L23